MVDDKRLIRNLKRQVKRVGNKKRRRFLKDLTAKPEDFEFGANRSEVMNEPRTKADRRGNDASRPDVDER